jgi:NAD(P)-dependent dehydrogenase (short-subunit alcohol dehydrogenase family)
MAVRETAIVFGVGPGLGWALAKRFMTENMQVPQECPALC